MTDIPWNGYYDEEGHHICKCGNKTNYQIMSGGREFYCRSCKTKGIYPEGRGGPRARLLDQGQDGIALLRAWVDQELARRKDEDKK